MKYLLTILFAMLIVSISAESNKNDLILVKGGIFMMGSDNRQYADSDEYYPHKVHLDSFFISKYETTIKDLAEVYNYALGKKYIYLKGYTVYLESNDKVCLEVNSGKNVKSVKYESGKFHYDEDAANHPAVFISWYGAVLYCNALSEMHKLAKCYDESFTECDFTKNGYRLPTEAEWEYAGRSGGKDYLFSWGNNLKKPDGNIADLSFKKIYPQYVVWDNYRDGYVYTSPVGSFKANELGLHDISGNVYEWCWNWSTDGYEEKEVKNPTGPETGTHKTTRGGSWYDTMNLLRLTNRSWHLPGYTGSMADQGFRVAKSKK